MQLCYFTQQCSYELKQCSPIIPLATALICFLVRLEPNFGTLRVWIEPGFVSLTFSKDLRLARKDIGEFEDECRVALAGSFGAWRGVGVTGEHSSGDDATYLLVWSVLNSYGHWQ